MPEIVSQIPQNTAFFCLARGYKSFHKHQYKKLILRNLFLNQYLNPSRRILSIIFHEGNMSSLDQFFIKLFSLNFRIEFIDISDKWKLPDTHIWSGSSVFGLGYSLMCKFQYHDCWQYLDEYEYVIRVDDDVLLMHPGEINQNVYICAKLYPETHDATNFSFPIFLKSLGLENFYDHEFPPNCYYFTSTKFWKSSVVQEYLGRVSSAPESLEDRWGDTVVMGVALKSLLLQPGPTLDKKIEYSHLSHSLRIQDGKEEFQDAGRFKIYSKALFDLINIYLNSWKEFRK